MGASRGWKWSETRREREVKMKGSAKAAGGGGGYAWPKWSTESNTYPGYLFPTFPYGLRDIIELLNRRYNLVRSVFAPFY